jgi:hypothetical protein
MFNNIAKGHFMMLYDQWKSVDGHYVAEPERQGAATFLLGVIKI